MYTTSVVCLVSGMWGSMVCVMEVGGMWGSMVCVVEVGGMWRELVCGDKCYVGEVAWEVNGMLG